MYIHTKFSTSSTTSTVVSNDLDLNYIHVVLNLVRSNTKINISTAVVPRYMMKN
jgi:hypothetical protein